MKIFIPLAFATLCSLLAPLSNAQIRLPVSSSGPVVLSDSVNSGGVHTTPIIIENGSSIVINATVGEAAPLVVMSPAASGPPVMIPGFIGSLYEVIELDLETDPAVIEPGASAALILTATLDDGSVIHVDPRTVGWQSNGPVGDVIANVSGASLTADSDSYGQPATISGSFFKLEPVELSFVIGGENAIPGLASSWTQAYGITSFDPLADDDGDGFPNVLEAALNLNPNIADGRDAVQNGTIDVDGKTYFQVRYRRHTGHSAISLSHERSTTLGAAPEDWSASGLVVVGFPEPIDADTEWITVRSSTPISVQTREFIRLRATYTAPTP